MSTGIIESTPAQPVEGISVSNDADNFSKYACGCFRQSQWPRNWTIVVVRSPWFVRVMMTVIALNAAFLAMWDPVANKYNLSSIRNDIVSDSELFFQIAYTVEMLIMMSAYGIFWEAKNAYFRKLWHWFDFLVVIFGWIALGFDYTTSDGASPLFRVIRVLRPLRGLQYVPGLTVLSNTFWRSLEQLGDVLLLLLLTYLVFTIVGMNVFQGKLHQRCGYQSTIDSSWMLYGPTADHYCSLSSTGGFRCPNATVTEPGTNISTQIVCASQFPGPNAGLTGFDNIFQGMLSIFVMVTLEGWSDVMYAYSEATNKWSQLYFLGVITYGSLIVLSLITAVLTINYTAEREKRDMKQSLETKRRRLEEMAKAAERRNKTLQKAKRTFVSDIELRLIYSYEKYGDTPGYTTVSRPMYERYLAKHSKQEIDEFSQKVSRAMLRRRKALHPDKELHLFSSEASTANEAEHPMRNSDIMASESSNLGETEDRSVINGVEDVPEFVSPENAESTFALAEIKRYPYEDQFGVPWGENRAAKCFVRTAYSIVMSAPFQYFIWGSILVNTVVLGYGHFLQSTQSIYISNIINNVLTAVYSVEALLKLSGFGPKYYFADSFNCFDFFIVVVSWIEIVVHFSTSGNTSSAASAFRVFRLFRILRLAQIWGSLKTLLRTIVRTFGGIYPFTVMLALFMYVFTVSGLMIFGGALVIPEYVLDPVTLQPLPNPAFDCTSLYGDFYFDNFTHCPGRSNYDTFLSSFISSFQVLTKENWNQLMYDMADSVGSWTPAIYFVLVVLFGPFIVLNLFLAVLIDSFMEVHDEERSQRKEQLEKRRKVKEERRRRRRQQKALRKKDTQTEQRHSPDEDDVVTSAVSANQSASTATSQHQRKLQRTDSVVSNTTTEKMSTGADSEGGLKSWIHSRLVSIEMGKSNDPLNTHPAFKHNSLGCIPPTSVVRVFSAVFVESFGFEMFSFLIIFLSCIVLMLDAPTQPGQQQDAYADSVLGGINTFCVSVFVLEMVLKILAFGFAMGAGSYCRDPWNIMDGIVAIFSVADLAVAGQPGLNMIKALRAFRPLKLIRHIEGMRVVIKSVIRAIVPVGQIALVALMFYFIFAVVATTLFGGALGACYICDTETTCSIPAVNISTGLPTQSRSCFPYRTYDVVNCPAEQQCVGGLAFRDQDTGLPVMLSWRNPQYDSSGISYSFDNVLVSMMILYEVSSLELWLEVMYRTCDITSIGHAPVRSASETNSLFFVVFIFFVNFFLMQLFVASVVDSFSETNTRYSGRAFMSESQFEWIQTQHKVNKMAFGHKTVPPQNKWRNAVYKLVIVSRRFDDFILVIIILNTILLASDHYMMNPVFRDFLTVMDYIFGAIYIGEMLLKIIALGVRYFSLFWFDFLIVLSIILTWATANSDLGDFFDVFEIFRLLRIARLIRKHQGISNLISTLAFSLPALLNILMLVLLIYFVYAVIGMQMFGTIPSSAYYAGQMNFVNEFANFHDFPSAFMTLFRMSTGESWNGLMHDLALESNLAWLYCISFTLMVQFILLNLFVAIVLGNFSAVLTKSKKDVISSKTLNDFVKIWQKQVDKFEEQVKIKFVNSLQSRLEEDSEENFRRSLYRSTSLHGDKAVIVDERCSRLALEIMDPNYLPAATFPDFFVSLTPPLGLPLSKSLSPSDLMRFIRTANIPVTRTGMINARTTLAALIDHALGAEKEDESYELMQSALKIRMISDSKSIAAHSKSIAEKASTHTVAEEIATRRLQLTARYLLARRKVERLVSEKVYSSGEGSEILEQLSLQYNRDVVACLLHFDLFSSHNTRG